VTTDSPAVARRRLRIALRRAREAIGFTQAYVAEELEWSISKINRIESGDVTVSSTDLRALLMLLGVTDAAEVRELTEEGRVARRRMWQDEPSFREHLTPAMRQMLQFETEAKVIRCFQPTLIPGILQTRDYADAIMNLWGDYIPAAALQVRFEARARRRAQVLERKSPPDYRVILDESVIQRVIGTRAIMADQLRFVIQLAASVETEIRVLPMAEGGPLSMLGAFTLFDVAGDENAVMYTEGPYEDDIVEDSNILQRHRDLYERMWDRSLSEVASMDLVKSRQAQLEAG
jgi:transcriptional regulator with XRE-family HTH domain